MITDLGDFGELRTHLDQAKCLRIRERVSAHCLARLLNEFLTGQLPVAFRLLIRFSAFVIHQILIGGKNRRRGKNENENDKRELVFKDDGQGRLRFQMSGCLPFRMESEFFQPLTRTVATTNSRLPQNMHRLSKCSAMVD